MPFKVLPCVQRLTCTEKGSFFTGTGLSTWTVGKGNARLNCLVSLPDSTRERNLAELESQNLWIQSQRTIFVSFYCKPIHDRYFYCKPIHDRYLISVLILTYKLEAKTQTLLTSTTTTPLCRPATSTPYRKSTTTDPPILNFYLTIRSWLNRLCFLFPLQERLIQLQNSARDSYESQISSLEQRSKKAFDQSTQLADLVENTEARCK